MTLFIDNKAIYLHIPKTGGTWFRNAIHRSRIEYQEIALTHNHFPAILANKPAGFYNDKFIFTFVRHPLTWYQSRWSFRMQHGWQMQHPLDYYCASNNFHDFVRRAIAFQPTGWVTYKYWLYIDHAPHIHFIGRTETLVRDAITVLKTIGIQFDEQTFTRTPRINVSDLSGQNSKAFAKYTPELLQQVLDVEHVAISKYYPDWPINIDEYT
jgi:hypothetical protein